MTSKIHLVFLSLFVMSGLAFSHRSPPKSPDIARPVSNHDSHVGPNKHNGPIPGSHVGNIEESNMAKPDFDLGIGFGDPFTGGGGPGGGLRFDLGPFGVIANWGFGPPRGYYAPVPYGLPYNQPYGVPYGIPYPTPYTQPWYGQGGQGAVPPGLGPYAPPYGWNPGCSGSTCGGAKHVKRNN